MRKCSTSAFVTIACESKLRPLPGPTPSLSPHSPLPRQAFVTMVIVISADFNGHCATGVEIDLLNQLPIYCEWSHLFRDLFPFSPPWWAMSPRQLWVAYGIKTIALSAHALPTLIDWKEDTTSEIDAAITGKIMIDLFEIVAFERCFVSWRREIEASKSILRKHRNVNIFRIKWFSPRWPLFSSPDDWIVLLPLTEACQSGLLLWITAVNVLVKT